MGDLGTGGQPFTLTLTRIRTLTRTLTLTLTGGYLLSSTMGRRGVLRNWRLHMRAFRNWRPTLHPHPTPTPNPNPNRRLPALLCHGEARSVEELEVAHASIRARVGADGGGAHILPLE